MCTITQGNKLRSVQPCVPAWQSSSSIGMQKIMLTCHRNKQDCLTLMHLLQGAPTPASTQCGVPIAILQGFDLTTYSRSYCHFLSQHLLLFHLRIICTINQNPIQLYKCIILIIFNLLHNGSVAWLLFTHNSDTSWWTHTDLRTISPTSSLSFSPPPPLYLSLMPFLPFTVLGFLFI
jgi:hypothetical protein